MSLFKHHRYSGYENKKYKEAIKDLDKAIELRNDYTKAYANRGETKSKLGDYDVWSFKMVHY